MIYISVVFVICNSNLYYCYYNSGISIICIIFALIKRDHTLDFCSSENLSFILEKFFFVLSRIYKIKITRDQWYTVLHVPVCFWFYTEKNMSARTFCYALQIMTLHFMFSDGDTLRNSWSNAWNDLSTSKPKINSVYAFKKSLEFIKAKVLRGCR